MAFTDKRRTFACLRLFSGSPVENARARWRETAGGEGGIRSRLIQNDFMSNWNCSRGLILPLMQFRKEGGHIS
jgi:hypothetical protein